MDFKDFAAKMKEKKGQNADTSAQRPYDFAEAYRLRAKMMGVLLRDARTSAARTIDDCARLLHVTSQQMESWEFGDDSPSLPQLELLAYYLDVPVSHFWGMQTSTINRAESDHIQPEYISLRNRMIGALLRQARDEVKLTLDQVSEQTHIDVNTLTAYELGDYPAPMPILLTLSDIYRKTLSYFLETSGQIGELLALREAWKHFMQLPEDVRAFAANPLNIGFIHIAVLLSQMPADRLRQVGASILDITM